MSILTDFPCWRQLLLICERELFAKCISGFDDILNISSPLRLAFLRDCSHYLMHTFHGIALVITPPRTFGNLQVFQAPPCSGIKYGVLSVIEWVGGFISCRFCEHYSTTMEQTVWARGPVRVVDPRCQVYWPPRCPRSYAKQTGSGSSMMNRYRWVDVRWISSSMFCPLLEQNVVGRLFI